MHLGDSCFSHKGFIVPNAVGVVIRESIDFVFDEEDRIDDAGVTTHCITNFGEFMLLLLLVNSDGSSWLANEQEILICCKVSDFVLIVLELFHHFYLVTFH